MSRTLNLLDYYTAGDPDYTNAFTGLNAAILASGGHIQVVIPPDPAPYETQQGLEITVPRVTVDIFGDVTLTGTTPRSLIKASGTGGPNLADLLDGIVLNLWGCTLDGGGMAAANAGYVYDTNDSDYDTIRFDNVNDYEINGFGNAHVTNGLISCLKVRRGFRGHVAGVEFSYAVHDNNIAITQNPGYFNKDNDSTWGYQIVERFITHHAKDFGFTAFNAKQVIFRQFKSYNNGSDGTSAQTLFPPEHPTSPGKIDNDGATGGGCSIEGTSDYDMATIIEDGEIWNCLTNGILVTQDGGTVRNVAIRDISSQSGSVFQNSGVCLFAKKGTPVGLTCENVTVDIASGKSLNDGFRAQKGGTEGFVSMELRGTCRVQGTQNYGVYMTGVTNAYVGPDVVLTGNNLGPNFPHSLLINNAPTNSNAGGGKARVHCQFISPGGNRSEIRAVGDSEFSRCFLDDAMEEPHHSDGSPNDAVLRIIGTSGGVVSRACIQHNHMRNSDFKPRFLGQISSVPTEPVAESYVGGNTGDYSEPMAVFTEATNKFGLSDVAIPDVSGSGTIETYINDDLLAGLRNSGTIAA